MSGCLKLFTMRNKILKQGKALQAKIAKEFKLFDIVTTQNIHSAT